MVSLIALFVALGGVTWAATTLPRNSVGPAQLQENAVTSRALDANSVGLSEIKKNAIDRSEMQKNAVGQLQLAQDAVTQQKMALGAVGQQQLKQGAVGQLQLQLGAVGAAQVKDHTLAPQEFQPNGLPEVGYASRELQGTPCPPFCPAEALGTGATNAGVLNLDIAPPTNGYTTSSGVVGAVAPSRLIANAQVVLHGDASGEGHCRLALFPVGTGVQTPFAAGTNATIASGTNVALPLAGGVDVDPGSYNVRVQCYADAVNTVSFDRGSLTVSIAPR